MEKRTPLCVLVYFLMQIWGRPTIVNDLQQHPLRNRWCGYMNSSCSWLTLYLTSIRKLAKSCIDELTEKFMKKLILMVTMLASTTSFAVAWGSKIDVSKFDSLKLCESSKGDLMRVLGHKPTREGREQGFNSLVWEYTKATMYKTENQQVIAFTNANNIFVDYVINPVSSVI